MVIATSLARVLGPVPYTGPRGALILPMGPCLLELADDHTAEVIWGAQGEWCASLSAQELGHAERTGHLVILD